jgi:GAF domain-containing protein
VHDVYADESFGYLAELKGPAFYAGTPVMVNGQDLATLCVIDFRPRFVSARLSQQQA